MRVGPWWVDGEGLSVRRVDGFRGRVVRRWVWLDRWGGFPCSVFLSIYISGQPSYPAVRLVVSGTALYAPTVLASCFALKEYTTYDMDTGMCMAKVGKYRGM